MTDNEYGDEKPAKQGKSEDETILELAKECFKEAYEAERDDWDHFKEVEAFIAQDQWPENIRKQREDANRPCLTLDLLGQYTRHVVNAGMMRSRDVRVLPMSGEADQEVGDVLAGLVRQIIQRSSSKIAYETGLRHSSSKGKGYWMAKVVPISGTGLEEIDVRTVRDPRMVLMDPQAEYPDGRDAEYVFLLKKLSKRQFKRSYPDAYKDGGCKSWHDIDADTVLPWISDGAVVVATFYYKKGDQLYWAICTPDKVLDKDKHHGDLPPIVRCIGEEYEYQGKQRTRGLINKSSMDAQRIHNYSASAATEGVALAPISPFVAAAGQTEPFSTEWGDAHKTPRAVLRYKAVTEAGQLLPPPQRQPVGDVPAGWAGIMEMVTQQTQMIMGMSQPQVLGTGGIPVQSGAGVEAQKDPGDINSYHYHEHWYNAIEQTGRVILAMIPHVYTKEQTVQIVGDDGNIDTAKLNPQQQQAVVEERGMSKLGYEKVLSKSYNHLIGRFDVAISTGPSSASKKAETNALMQSIVQAYPPLMEKAGDLVVGSMDMAGADVLAKRLKRALPPGLADEDDDEAMMMQKLNQLAMENQQLKQTAAEQQQLILAEGQKAEQRMKEALLKAQADFEKQQEKHRAEMLAARLDHEDTMQLEVMKAHVSLEKAQFDGAIKLILEQMKQTHTVDMRIFELLSQTAEMPTHQERMSGYAGVLGALNESGSPPPAEEQPAEPPPAPVEPQKPKRRRLKLTRADGSVSYAELLDDQDEDDGGGRDVTVTRSDGTKRRTKITEEDQA